MSTGARESWGRHRPLWRRALGIRARRTWHDEHPLPEGWRPRTKVDVLGREVEPWVWMITDALGEYDGGESWLPVGHDPDQAAWDLLQGWLARQRGLTTEHRRQIRMVARRAGYDGSGVGVADAMEAISA